MFLRTNILWVGFSTIRFESNTKAWLTSQSTYTNGNYVKRELNVWQCQAASSCFTYRRTIVAVIANFYCCTRNFGSYSIHIVYLTVLIYYFIYEFFYRWLKLPLLSMVFIGLLSLIENRASISTLLALTDKDHVAYCTTSPPIFADEKKNKKKEKNPNHCFRSHPVGYVSLTLNGWRMYEWRWIST